MAHNSEIFFFLNDFCVTSVKVLFNWFVFCLSLELLHPYVPCGFKDLVCSIADVKMMYLFIMCSICPGSNSGFSGSRKAMLAASAALQQFCSSFNLHKCVRFFQWISTSPCYFLLGGFALYVICSLGTRLGFCVIDHGEDFSLFQVSFGVRNETY